ncbi:hypothetical protein K440DRAFT_362752 [Wilcoxina mikolae CBS 423.85]|nr:hypothetical protein K440DRAFT_362752 [Wilcoxina mikolae CBS 423.85]
MDYISKKFEDQCQWAQPTSQLVYPLAITSACTSKVVVLLSPYGWKCQQHSIDGNG